MYISMSIITIVRMWSFWVSVRAIVMMVMISHNMMMIDVIRSIVVVSPISWIVIPIVR